MLHKRAIGIMPDRYPSKRSLPNETVWVLGDIVSVRSLSTIEVDLRTHYCEFGGSLFTNRRRTHR
jgi:hypothetical protein